MPHEEHHYGPAFIPAPVFHDPELSTQAKLLAGRITVLTRREGYCWASNEWLAEDMNANPRTFERWIKELLDSPHFRAEYQRSAGRGTVRRIYPHFHNPLRTDAEWSADHPPKSAESVSSKNRESETLSAGARSRTRGNGNSGGQRPACGICGNVVTGRVCRRCHPHVQGTS